MDLTETLSSRDGSCFSTLAMELHQQVVMLTCRNVDMLHLDTNIRYVFGCHNWIDKQCKYQRTLDLELVQNPPVQRPDWRLTQVTPPSHLNSPFRPGFQLRAPGSTANSERAGQSPAPPQAGWTPPEGSVWLQKQAHSPMQQPQAAVRPQRLPVTLQQQPTAATDARLDVHRKLQEDYERYRQVALRRGQSSRQESMVPAEQGSDTRGIGVLGKRLQAAHSMARRSRLQRQRTADVVPRLDSARVAGQAKQPLQFTEQPQQYAAQPMQNAHQAQQYVEQPPRYVDQPQQSADQPQQSAVQYSPQRMSGRIQYIRASAPPWSEGRRSTDRGARSPSRFADQDRQQASAPELAQSLRIPAWR